MGMGYGLESNTSIVMRKHHWLFKLKGISCQDSAVSKALPARRSARPGLSWKEEEFPHLNENISYPMKPEWKPIQLHLYDLSCRNNPVYNWIVKNQSLTGSGIYNPRDGFFRPVISAGLKRTATLEMLDGCKNIVETWVFEGCYPKSIEWGDLEMDLSDVVTVDITLGYDRAYIEESLIPVQQGNPIKEPSKDQITSDPPRQSILDLSPDNPFLNPNIPY